MQKSDGGVSNFHIPAQSLTKENCHNSRTNDHIYMKLRPVTKNDERNKTTSKKLRMTSCRQKCVVIVLFLFYGQFEVICKSDSRCIVRKTYIFINSNLLIYKTENKTETSQAQLLQYCFQQRYYFCQKKLLLLLFFQINADINQFQRALVLKSIFSETKYLCVLRYQISSFWHNYNEF